MTFSVTHIRDATVYCGDCREILPTLQDVDAVITDPPYGNSNHDDDWNARLNCHRGISNKPIANDTQKEMRAVVDFVLSQSARLLPKERSACCCFCGGGGPYPTFAWLAERMDRDGLEFFHSVVWDKRNPGLGQRYRRQHEMLMVAHRAGGRIRWNEGRGTVPNVFSLMPKKIRAHPNEKPIELLEWIVGIHTDLEDVVLDPFMGGGTTGVACAQLGRKFIGIEVEPRYFDIACRRIESAQRQSDMFLPLRSAPETPDMFGSTA